MEDKIKVFFILPTLSAGGAERVISFVAQNIDDAKFDVRLIIIGFEKDNKYRINGINVTYLNKSRTLNGVFDICKIILLNKPQVVISSISNLNVMMGLISVLFPRTIFIGRHTFILKEAKNSNKSTFQSIFDYWDFGNKNLDYFICQSEDMKQGLINVYGIHKDKITVINNPITETTFFKANQSQHKIKKYITVGRLSRLKGHIRILEILNKVNFPFHYTIIGDGDFFNDIVAKVHELGLEEKVEFINYTENVSQYLIEHDMFLQGSYSEGFPNALLESCSVGTPAIAFDVPGGTKEIIEHEVNGFLVNTPDEFLECLHDQRIWNPETVRDSVYKKFNKDNIIRDYEQFLSKVLN
ncbi:glycosyltransferase involved in cell wall biosynthesis [Winogradskyella epiphytica]|uniref:Glycosyltransferase involved in cell wall biosynthesis n=1 Tax=Winogradskyella epiphytica TaxID=262005 RepID=A0A2V4YE01_9FLAO|nr:glycosyltransferase [Winogradskyella epiphytica]PYE81707.1 glycosyltransferase involved in cell wall biosynthesis [Winogradskyella epiphytica]GGW63244.1 glycosyl transferase family 1 [Winogradskyella epiphytica]